MCQHLSFLDSGKAAGGLPGSEPHSGNPTVWDRRGAYGNVSDGLGYSGTYRGNADTAKPRPKVARAVLLSRPGPRSALHGRQRRPNFRPVVAQGIIAIGQFGIGVITLSQFGIGLFSLSQFTIAGYALAQFAIAWSLIAQIGLYVDQGYGQIVYRVSDLLGRLP